VFSIEKPLATRNILIFSMFDNIFEYFSPAFCLGIRFVSEILLVIRFKVLLTFLKIY